MHLFVHVSLHVCVCVYMCSVRRQTHFKLNLACTISLYVVVRDADFKDLFLLIINRTFKKNDTKHKVRVFPKLKNCWYAIFKLLLRLKIAAKSE